MNNEICCLCNKVRAAHDSQVCLKCIAIMNAERNKTNPELFDVEFEVK